MFMAGNCQRPLCCFTWTLFTWLLIFGIASPHCALADEEVTFFTEEDFSRAKWLPPVSYRRYGDIRGKAQLLWSNRVGDVGKRRNGVKYLAEKWPNAVVPYMLSTQYTSTEKAVLASAVLAYHRETCIRFVPANGQQDYLYIGKIDGCYSDVGKTGGKQELSIDKGCIDVSTIIHELMHAIGFWHEHERWDRDDFVIINWENILREASDQFGKVSLKDSSYYEEPYDYFSILHYDSHAFTRNGLVTVEAKEQDYTPIIGTLKYFSRGDVRKINRMYQCKKVRLSNGVTAFRSTLEALPSYLNFIYKPAPGGKVTDLKDCQDNAFHCRQLRTFCQLSVLRQTMYKNCKKTCGYCY